MRLSKQCQHSCQRKFSSANGERIRPRPTQIRIRPDEKARSFFRNRQIVMVQSIVPPYVDQCQTGSLLFRCSRSTDSFSFVQSIYTPHTYDNTIDVCDTEPWPHGNPNDETHC